MVSHVLRAFVVVGVEVVAVGEHGADGRDGAEWRSGELGWKTMDCGSR